MCIIKRDGSAIEFDVSKICEAISKAFESVYAEIKEEIEEAIKNISNALYSFAHTLAHWIFHAFYSITSRIKGAICYDPHAATRLAAVLIVRVKHLAVSFLEHTSETRVAVLNRTQDRGTSENSDSDCYFYFYYYVVRTSAA